MEIQTLGQNGEWSFSWGVLHNLVSDNINSDG